MNALGLLLRIHVRGQTECIKDRLKILSGKFMTKVIAYSMLTV